MRELVYDFFKQNGYVFELVLSVHLFTYWMHRRRYFWLRLAGCAAALLAVSMLWQLLPVDNVVVRSLRTVLFFALVIPCVQLCYRVRTNTAIFYITAACASQHVAYKAARSTVSLVWMSHPGLLQMPGVDLLYAVLFVVYLVLCAAVFGRALCEAAGQDESICAITAAMKYGTGLQFFGHAFPGRFFDVGMAEQHEVTFAAGLASQGMTPVAAIYSTFLQRAYDQIIHDVGLLRVKVVFAIDRAGLVPADGETHQGVYDPAFLSQVGIPTYSPSNYAELQYWLAQLLHPSFEGPQAIRYPRGKGEGCGLPETLTELPIGKAEIISQDETPGGITLLALGNMNAVAAKTGELLRLAGLSITHVNARFIKPIDKECLLEQARRSKLIVTLEDHTISGGFGSAVMEALSELGCRIPVLRVGASET